MKSRRSKFEKKIRLRKGKWTNQLIRFKKLYVRKMWTKKRRKRWKQQQQQNVDFLKTWKKKLWTTFICSSFISLFFIFRDVPSHFPTLILSRNWHSKILFDGWVRRLTEESKKKNLIFFSNNWLLRLFFVLHSPLIVVADVIVGNKF